MAAARRRRPRQGRQQNTSRGGQTAPSQTPPASPIRLLWVPLALTLGLFLVSFVPRVQQSGVLTRSLWAAAGGLLLWQIALFTRLRRTTAVRSFRTVLRPQHYLQASV